MSAIGWSVAVGIVGLAGSATLEGWLARRAPAAPMRAWLLGLAALGPAWLVGLVGLLNATGAGTVAAPRGAFLAPSAAALLGMIASDAAARRLRESGRPGPGIVYWLLGVLAFLPAWAITAALLARLAH